MESKPPLSTIVSLICCSMLSYPMISFALSCPAPRAFVRSNVLQQIEIGLEDIEVPPTREAEYLQRTFDKLMESSDSSAFSSLSHRRFYPAWEVRRKANEVLEIIKEVDRLTPKGLTEDQEILMYLAALDKLAYVPYSLSDYVVKDRKRKEPVLDKDIKVTWGFFYIGSVTQSLTEMVTCMVKAKPPSGTSK